MVNKKMSAKIAKAGKKDHGADKDNLSKSFQDCQKEKNEYLSGWQRARADLLNYKRGESERIKEIMDMEKEGLIFKLLPVLDSFQRAEKEIPPETEKSSFLEGVTQIRTQLKKILEQEGVMEIESMGKKFNPKYHEAIGEYEVPGKEEGTIVEEVQRGYTLKDKVIRPARVRIAK